MEVIAPLDHHELLVVIVQLTVLLLVARVLGEAFASIGQPAVVGELLAGVLLGPSVLGLVAPGVYRSLFAVSEAQFHLLEVVSWLGLIMLLIVTGLETDLDLILANGRTALVLSLGGIVVPFTTGFALGWVMPAAFIAAPGQRLVFSLFVATAMSISAIPVIAKVLLELDVIRRDVGQLILAAGMIDDTIGWILLATVAGLARTGGVDLGTAATTVLSVLVFLGLAITVGRRAVATTIRWVDNVVGGDIALCSTLMLFALAAGAVTQFMGLEAILGAFVVGVLVGRVNRFEHRVRRSFETVTLAVFAPLFFAIAGLRTDLVALADPTVFGVGLIVLGVACIGKFGGIVGVARPAGLSWWEAISIGGGMNARGAMEIIVATIGLGLGILTTSTYSIIVAVAIVTSLMAPAIMRWSIPKIEMSEAERARIEREQYARESFVGSLTRVLLSTRGTVDARYAARLLGPLLRETEADLDVLSVTGRSEPSGSGGRLRRWLRPRRLFEWGTNVRRGDHPERGERNDESAPADGFDDIDAQLARWNRSGRRLTRDADGNVSDAILETACTDYDLVVFGERTLGRGLDEPLFSESIDRVVQEVPCPTMVVSTSDRVQRDPALIDEPIRRILLPTVGTQSSRHAAEVAFAIAVAERALVEVVHVITHPDPSDQFAGPPDVSREREIGRQIVDREAELGRKLDAKVTTTVTRASDPGEAIVELADETGADVIVMGSSTRRISRRAFFGPTVERVATTAACPVAVLSSV
ncbi:Na/H antiporter [Halovivax asiaticus JCM 14624]|uniref:Na/H antiporter n=1 Tax=Halovivax asiaticus JCM 14624 TaxID=1227490 RepID=M0BSF7_9EURY|nr:cation:proton antiporter [Halovivax asiaticus]ELZ12619.1 Na/H antiporter [Halovivax asiaticus JCM 14624]